MSGLSYHDCSGVFRPPLFVKDFVVGRIALSVSSHFDTFHISSGYPGKFDATFTAQRTTRPTILYCRCMNVLAEEPSRCLAKIRWNTRTDTLTWTA